MRPPGLRRRLANTAGLFTPSPANAGGEAERLRGMPRAPLSASKLCLLAGRVGEWCRRISAHVLEPRLKACCRQDVRALTPPPPNLPAFAHSARCSSAREPVARKRASSPPAFAGGG